MLLPMAYFLENSSHKNYKERKKERRKEGRKEIQPKLRYVVFLHTHIIAELLIGEGKRIRFLQETDLEIESNAINVMN